MTVYLWWLVVTTTIWGNGFIMMGRLSLSLYSDDHTLPCMTGGEQWWATLTDENLFHPHALWQWRWACPAHLSCDIMDDYDRQAFPTSYSANSPLLMMYVCLPIDRRWQQPRWWHWTGNLLRTEEGAGLLFPNDRHGKSSHRLKRMPCMCLPYYSTCYWRVIIQPPGQEEEPTCEGGLYCILPFLWVNLQGWTSQWICNLLVCVGILMRWAFPCCGSLPWRGRTPHWPRHVELPSRKPFSSFSVLIEGIHSMKTKKWRMMISGIKIPMKFWPW